MCTLTCLAGSVLESSDGRRARLRLVFSRDERRTRPVGLPPEVTICGGRKVLMPRDGGAGGTWIAANDAGVVFALLNVNPPSRSRHLRGRFRTRGSVIPQLTGASSAAGAASRACALPLEAYRPFRVLAFDAAGQVAEVLWTSDGVRHRLGRLPDSLLRTSSGLGDPLVAEPRRRLFVRMLRAAAGRPSAAQDAFHRHQWPGRGAVSVMMSRADARTVSITTVEVGDHGVWMNYVAVRP